MKGECNDCDFVGELVYQSRCEDCDTERHPEGGSE